MFKKVLIAITALALLTACSASVNVPGETQLTPTQKLTYMYQVYNAQYEDYVYMANSPNLTEEQKQILRAKKPILDSLRVMIPAYDASVQNGAPSVSQEQEIYNLLNKLQTMTN